MNELLELVTNLREYMDEAPACRDCKHCHGEKDKDDILRAKCGYFGIGGDVSYGGICPHWSVRWRKVV